MARHDQLLEFLGEMAEQFGHFRVVAINQSISSPGSSPISEIIADESDNEICLIRAASDQAFLNLDTFYMNLRGILDRYPEHSLMVSEWFQIDDEHTGRADVPLKNVEVDEDSNEFRLLY